MLSRSVGSISAEYTKYKEVGGTLNKSAYKECFSNNQNLFVQLLCDPNRSNFAEIFFRILQNDLKSSLALAQTCKSLYTQSPFWFNNRTREIVMQYVQRGTYYKDYIKEGGWKDFIVISAKIAGVALTIASGVKAGIHASRIPANAPTKVITITDENGNQIEVTVIDHPEATKRNIWAAVAAAAGTVTVVGIVAHGLLQLFDDVDLGLFLTSEKDWIKIPHGIGIVSPDFEKWKMRKIRTNLLFSPPNWRQHPELSKKVCRISNDFILFPVKGKCGHTVDYRSFRARALNKRYPSPLECPICLKKPNLNLSILKFDKREFDSIQGLIHLAVQSPIPPAVN